MNDVGGSGRSERGESGRPTALTLDEVVATQPELGPSAPDGGFGWFVCAGTLFFQALIPCLTVNLGIFLAFSKLENGTSDYRNLRLWDEKILYVSLSFFFARGFFDSYARSLVTNTTTPRLIAVVGTCLTCAGLLFMWMGMTGKNEYWLYPLAGVLSGMGATVTLVQCETLLAQYFRMKLPILTQISQCVATLGFLIAPVVLGKHILSSTLTHVLLWYQAIILQGLIVSLIFKKPLYLKSKKSTKAYHFISPNPDDEEDILSKNSRELQIKRQTNSEARVSTIPIPPGSETQPGTSSAEGQRTEQKKWETFDDEEEEVKYQKLNNWETFDDDKSAPKRQSWERFEDEGPPSPGIANHLSVAEEEKKTEEKGNLPSPLFSDLPVNNNDTYAYDDEIVTETTNSNVFVANNSQNENSRRYLDILMEPTFYKSLLTMIANTYSSFVYYTLYPSYLYITANSVNIRQMTGLIGGLSLVNLVFLCVIYWIYIDKMKRAVCLGAFYWLGCAGYLIIIDFTREYLLLVGGALIVLSIGVLEHLSKPLLGIPLRGRSSSESSLLTMFSSLSLLVFIFLDVSFKTCFRLVATLHFFTGILWLANFTSKKLGLR